MGLGVTKIYEIDMNNFQYCIYIDIEYYSPGLGTRRVRSRTFVFVATFVTSVKQLLHFLDFVATFFVCLTAFTISAIIIVYCSDNCCLLFKK